MALEMVQAGPPDAAVIASLGRQTFAETFEALFVGYEPDLEAYLDQTFDEAKIRRSLGYDLNHYLLAYVDGQPVGYAKLKRDSAQAALEGARQVQLQKIYVLRSYLDRRVGSALLEACLKVAEQKNFLWMWLSVVQSNTRAIRFYQRAGFEPGGAHQFTIGSQRFAFHWMKRPLLVAR